jgi:hypothetical protein
VVLFCDSQFTTNVQSDTASQIRVPSFSAVLVEIGIAVVPAIILAIVKVSYQRNGRSKISQRLRFLVSPLRHIRGFGTYLPYETLEHALLTNGSIKTVWLDPSCIVDGHFILPVQGLEASVPFDEVLPFTSYTGRRGSLLYYSISYSDYDVGTVQWSDTHTDRYYSHVLVSDQAEQRIRKDRKVFVSREALRTHQTDFGFDEHIVDEKRYRKGPKLTTNADPLQPKISSFFSPIATHEDLVPATLSISSSNLVHNVHMAREVDEDDASNDPQDLFDGHSSDESDDNDDDIDELLSNLN